MRHEPDYRKYVIVAASILVLMGLRWITKANLVADWKEQSAGFTYEMPRVSAVGNEFDLSGREIDRQIMSEEKKEAAKLAAVAAQKEAAKIKRAQAPAKKADGKEKAAKKKTFATEVVNTRADESTLGAEDKAAQANAEVPGGRNFEGLRKKEDEKKEQDLAEDVKKNQNNEEDTQADKKSADEWRKLLSQNVSAELIGKFVAAHTAKEITDEDFYGIVLGLYNEPTPEQNETALNILRQDRSTVQFMYLAKNYAKLEEKKRAAIWTIMLGFAQVGRIQALNPAILNPDPAVAQLGLQVLKYAVDSRMQINGQQNGRGVAGGGPQNFVIFIGTLSLVSSQQGQNAALAKTLLEQIRKILII